MVCRVCVFLWLAWFFSVCLSMLVSFCCCLFLLFFHCVQYSLVRLLSFLSLKCCVMSGESCWINAHFVMCVQFVFVFSVLLLLLGVMFRGGVLDIQYCIPSKPCSHGHGIPSIYQSVHRLSKANVATVRKILRTNAFVLPSRLVLRLRCLFIVIVFPGGQRYFMLAEMLSVVALRLRCLLFIGLFLRRTRVT